MDGRYENPNEAGAFPESESTERALIRQLVLTLTALGNYLGVAQHTCIEGPGPKDALPQVAIESALQQFSHASAIVKRLQHVSRPSCEPPRSADTQPAQVQKPSELAEATLGTRHNQPTDSSQPSGMRA
jgi:hypothetical protein